MNAVASRWQTPAEMVHVSAPTSEGGYFNLEWYEPTLNGGKRRRQTTGGRTLEKAWAKALKLEAELTASATPKSRQPMTAAIEYWLAPSTRRFRGGQWSESHAREMDRYARTYFRPMLGKLRVLDVRRSHLQQVINAAPTHSEGDRVRRYLINLINTVRAQEWLAPGQVIDTTWLGWEGKSANAKPSVSGEDDAFVPDRLRPSDAQVQALAAAMGEQGRGVWWRELMVYTAAYSGVRFGELLALTADDVDPAERRISVQWQVVEKAKGSQKRDRPKMNKVRTTIFPSATPLGYQLEQELRRRCAEARVEQAAGRNDGALLFPNNRGGWLRQSNFHDQVWSKAAKRAGWDWTAETRTASHITGGTVQIERWAMTWHSLRHTFCTWALSTARLDIGTVSVLAGHSSSDTTSRIYVGRQADTIDKALKATE